MGQGAVAARGQAAAKAGGGRGQALAQVVGSRQGAPKGAGAGARGRAGRRQARAGASERRRAPFGRACAAGVGQGAVGEARKLVGAKAAAPCAREALAQALGGAQGAVAAAARALAGAGAAGARAAAAGRAGRAGRASGGASGGGGGRAEVGAAEAGGCAGERHSKQGAVADACSVGRQGSARRARVQARRRGAGAQVGRGAGAAARRRACPKARRPVARGARASAGAKARGAGADASAGAQARTEARTQARTQARAGAGVEARTQARAQASACAGAGARGAGRGRCVGAAAFRQWVELLVLLWAQEMRSRLIRACDRSRPPLATSSAAGAARARRRRPLRAAGARAAGALERGPARSLGQAFGSRCASHIAILCIGDQGTSASRERDPSCTHGVRRTTDCPPAVALRPVFCHRRACFCKSPRCWLIKRKHHMCTFPFVVGLQQHARALCTPASSWQRHSATCSTASLKKRDAQHRNATAIEPWCAPY